MFAATIFLFGIAVRGAHFRSLPQEFFSPLHLVSSNDLHVGYVV
jgi:hypothetical protein